MDQQTLTTIVATLGSVAAMLSYLHAVKKSLEGKIEQVRAGAKADNAATRADLTAHNDETRRQMQSGFDDVNRTLAILEQRTYDLASRLPSTATGTADS